MKVGPGQFVGISPLEVRYQLAQSAHTDLPSRRFKRVL